MKNSCHAGNYKIGLQVVIETSSNDFSTNMWLPAWHTYQIVYGKSPNYSQPSLGIILKIFLLFVILNIKWQYIVSKKKIKSNRTMMCYLWYIFYQSFFLLYESNTNEKILSCRVLFNKNLLCIFLYIWIGITKLFC